MRLRVSVFVAASACACRCVIVWVNVPLGVKEGGALSAKRDSGLSARVDTQGCGDMVYSDISHISQRDT